MKQRAKVFVCAVCVSLVCISACIGDHRRPGQKGLTLPLPEVSLQMQSVLGSTEHNVSREIDEDTKGKGIQDVAVATQYNSSQNGEEAAKHNKRKGVDEAKQHNRSQDVEGTQHNRSQDVEGMQHNRSQDVEGTQHNRSQDVEGTQHNRSQDVEGTQHNRSQDVKGTQHNSIQGAEAALCNKSHDVKAMQHNGSQDVEARQHNRSQHVEAMQHSISQDVETMQHSRIQDLEAIQHNRSQGIEAILYNRSHDVEARQHNRSHDDDIVTQHNKSQGVAEATQHSISQNTEIIQHSSSQDIGIQQHNKSQGDDGTLGLQHNRSQGMDWTMQRYRNQDVDGVSQHNGSQGDEPMKQNRNLSTDGSMKHRRGKDNICGKNAGDFLIHVEEYSMTNDSYKIVTIQSNTSLSVKMVDVDKHAMDFLVFQAHSQNHYLILSHDMDGGTDCHANSTDPGLVVFVDEESYLYEDSFRVYLSNCHGKNITVLFMAQNYTNQEPIPGNYKAPCLPQPFLIMDTNILTTKVAYRAASLPGMESEKVLGNLRYETFLTYMYERDLSESKYWNALISTSTLEGLKKNGKSVAVRKNNDTAEQLSMWLVSYSGVGAVVTVVVSFNGSNGTLYSSAVSYGCNFIDGEKYSCTKLVTSLAKLFCASLLFFGALLLFLGHRWLNFTMFMSGFLFSWCILFLLFSQDSRSTIDALGWGTLLGAVIGGTLWLVGWHKFRRPFHSSLLIIIMAVLFVGMVVTYFLRFAIAPTIANLSAFVVFPVFFAIMIIGYSIIDIKKVHIFSCALLGSYAVIVPFAFYFGSSLTYIVINVLGLITVEHYSDAVGYPPFQVCDIILLCLWVVLFGTGMTYQLYRERASPPFHPPNLTSWKNFKRSMNFVFDKVFACLPMDPDPGGIGIEDRPEWMLRVVYTSKLVWRRLTCDRNDPSESGYESFPRLRSFSQYTEQDSHHNESRMRVIMARLREWQERVRNYFRRGGERLLQEDENEENQREEEAEEDESQLLEGSVSCCNFRNSQVVLDDECIANGQPQV